MTIKRRIDTLIGDYFFNKEIPIYINRVAESYELHEHIHDFLELNYVSEGTGSHVINGVTSSVKKGDLFLLPMGISHVYRPSTASDADPLIVYNCVVDADSLLEVLSTYPGSEVIEPLLKETQYRYYDDRWQQFQRLFEQVYEEYQRGREGWVISVYTYVIQILIHLQRLDTETQLRIQPSSSGWEDMVHELHTNYAGSITVSEMAAKMKVSVRQLHRLFVKHTGASMSHYVQKIRIQAACDLLRTTDLLISEVSEQVGYHDVSYFHALFKRKTGSAPKAYRRLVRSMSLEND
ncbi:AraC family transcriptional regulator [Paenibacillus sp. PK4536]|uniref:AraC family transcriptional regulator n=1 Tax=Paenibacillus sp. PK4536 TaxID=3024576 RepID=UPI002358D34C|nr:AraC family transcriptional regulator [Paenibacillus sp. PK4536]WIM38310.1 AraC family transcriptional regulator [Paenibacillus sp. PK4536]